MRARRRRARTRTACDDYRQHLAMTLEQTRLRAVIYTRISRDDGNTQGAGPIERQLEDCRTLSTRTRVAP